MFQIGQVKQELSRKDTELLALQTKLETLTNQFSDSKQHIEVLKESLTAKEQRAAILQTEVKWAILCLLTVHREREKTHSFFCSEAVQSCSHPALLVPSSLCL